MSVIEITPASRMRKSRRAQEAENQSRKGDSVTQHSLPEVRLCDYAGQDSPRRLSAD
jgi:hypothetical protein